MSGGVLCVYAIADSFPDPVATGLHGVPLRTIECGSVQAIVSEHEVAPEPDEDLLWAYEQVVEELMEGATILPMRFGSTVEGPEALVAMLERRQEEFVALLERVRGAIELSVRARLPDDAEPRELEPRLPVHTGPGTAYLFERARRQRRGEAVTDLIHRPLALLARRSVLKAGQSDPSEFKAAYLVEEKAVDAFGQRVGRLNTTLGDVKVKLHRPLAALQLRLRGAGMSGRRRQQASRRDKLLAGEPELTLFGDELDRLDGALRRRVNADREGLEKGLAQPVLTLIELLRQLMERQALRRIDGGSLTADEIERLGETFMLLEERMAELKEAFGIEDEDLNLDLGPLGRLI